MRNRSVSAVTVVLFTLAMLFGSALQAQWNPSGNTTTNPIYRSGGVSVGTTAAGPNTLSVKNGASQDGVSIDGTNPAVLLRNSSVFGYFGLVTTAASFFTNTAVNDIIIRAESGKIQFGQGYNAATMTISGSHVGIGNASPTVPFNVVATNTDATNNVQSTSETDLVVNPTAAQAVTATRNAQFGYASVPSGNTNAVGEIHGSEGDANNYGTAYVNVLRGQHGSAYNTNASSNVGSVVGASGYAQSDSGTVGQLVGLHSFTNVLGGTVTTQYGMYLQAQHTAGTLTNQYGIYDDVDSGTATNRYGLFLHTGSGTATNDFGLYQDAATAKNYLAGSLGIGTTSPTSPLTVNGAIYSQSGGFKFPDGTVQTTAASGGSTVTATNVSSGNFGANTSGGNYSFPARLGIGTTTPGASLDIAAGVTARGNDTDLLIGSAVPQIEWYGPTTSAVANYDGSQMNFWTNGPSFVRTLTVGNNGHVGIATATAPQPLTVPITATGNGISLGAFNSLVAGQFAFIGQTGTDGTFNAGNLSSNDNGATGMAIVHTSGGAGNSAELAFVTRNDGIDSRERMRIDRSGNVGIGTTSPSSPLTVNGVVYSQSGGFKFPDGSVQTSAAAGGGAGTIAAANVSAGAFGANSSGGNFTFPARVGVGTGTPANQLHVFTATNLDGIAVDGSSNPAINLRNAGTTMGYLGLATLSNAFFAGSVANDLVLQSAGGRIHIGQGSGTPAMTISGGNVGIGIETPTIPLNVVSTNTDSTTASAVANETDLTVNPSAAQATTVTRVAKVDYAKVPAGSTNAVGEIRGGEGDAENYGSGSVNMLRGHIGWAYNQNASANIGTAVGAGAYTQVDAGTVGTMMNLHSWGEIYGGTVTEQYGIYSQVSNAGPNLLPNQYGIYDVVNGGNVTNRYELYLHTGAGTATNNYGIYQDTAAARNYLAGPLSVGNTGGAYSLNVFGAAAITTGADASVPRFITYDDGLNAAYTTYGADTSTNYKSTGAYFWKTVPTGSTRMTAAGTQTMVLDSVGNLATAGQIISQSGGFKFPDGTVQTTAATGGGSGSVTAANVSAGAFGANSSGGNFSFPARLGVGTATPGASVDIAAGVTPRGSDTDLLIGSTVPQIEWYRPEASAVINYDGSQMSFWTNGPSFVRTLTVGNNGHVGIATATAPQPLTVPIAATGNGISLGAWNSLVAGQFAFIGQTGTDGTFNSGNLSSADNGAAGMAIVHTSGGAGNSAELAFVTHNNGTDSRERMRIDRAGKVGIADSAPTFQLEVAHSSTSAALGDPAQYGLGLINSSGTANSWSNISFAQSGGGAVLASVGAQFKGSNVTDLVLATNNGPGGTTEKMRVTGAGAVGIGTTPAAGYLLDVNGNIHAAGSITGATVINAIFQDVAEWVPATDNALEPGTVVVVDPQKGNGVMASSESYDTTVAGVVSAHPGIVLGKPGDGKAQVATTGRVKVKVDASKGAIRIGDLLVTSDIAGTAMKSEPMVVNGRRFHQPGTIIGKALEPLASGTGEILVLLSLQ